MTAEEALAAVHQILWPESWGGEWREWSGADDLEAIAFVVNLAEQAGHIKTNNPRIAGDGVKQ
jgi:hypothetical protein